MQQTDRRRAMRNVVFWTEGHIRCNNTNGMCSSSANNVVVVSIIDSDRRRGVVKPVHVDETFLLRL